MKSREPEGSRPAFPPDPRRIASAGTDQLTVGITTAASIGSKLA